MSQYVNCTGVKRESFARPMNALHTLRVVIVRRVNPHYYGFGVFYAR